MNTKKCECSNQQSSKQLNDDRREYLKTGKINKCKSKHCDRSSDDDGYEMDDILNDNSNVKGCWSKKKSRIDQEAINTKFPSTWTGICVSRKSTIQSKREHHLSKTSTAEAETITATRIGEKLTHLITLQHQQTHQKKK